MMIFDMNLNTTSWEFQLKHHEDFKKIENKLRNLYSTERGQPCQPVFGSSESASESEKGETVCFFHRSPETISLEVHFASFQSRSGRDVW
jgi:hypothetical protein